MLMFYSIFDQINADLVSIRDFNKKFFFKSYRPQTVEWYKCIIVAINYISEQRPIIVPTGMDSDLHANPCLHATCGDLKVNGFILLLGDPKSLRTPEWDFFFGGGSLRFYSTCTWDHLTDVRICSTTTFFSPTLARSSSSLCCLSLPALLSHRYVSALTTPAHLSPVDFHYSLPPQVPTFQITSPNANHAMSLPPAAHAPYPPEEDQPLLRRYQVPLHEARGHEPYRQQQRGSYLRDSTGSPSLSSPYRLAQEEEYESTQEYLSSMEQPKRSSRHWRRSRLNGHVAPRGYQPSRDLGSRSCLSDSDAEGEEGESTPFLSMLNMNAAEPVTLYRPVPDTQTSHARAGGTGHAPTTDQTDALALQTGQCTPLERPPPIHKKAIYYRHAPIRNILFYITDRYCKQMKYYFHFSRSCLLVNSKDFFYRENSIYMYTLIYSIKRCANFFTT